jgi:hypothetical protein
MNSTVGRPRKLTQAEIERVSAWYTGYCQWLAQRPPTLEMLATELGVSRHTVTRVLHRLDRFKAAAPDQRAAVLAAVAAVSGVFRVSHSGMPPIGRSGRGRLCMSGSSRPPHPQAQSIRSGPCGFEIDGTETTGEGRDCV